MKSATGVIIGMIAAIARQRAAKMLKWKISRREARRRIGRCRLRHIVGAAEIMPGIYAKAGLRRGTVYQLQAPAINEMADYRCLTLTVALRWRLSAMYARRLSKRMFD